MKVPYTEASHVLVLDSSLEQVECVGLNLTEIGLRIFTTGWMRRLWTLQEGALPRKLWFQFKDTAVDLDWVKIGAFECFLGVTGRQLLGYDLVVAHHGLRGFFHQFAFEANTDLVSVSKALKFRSVSVPTDEPLFVGGMFKLDPGYILDGSESTRMQRLFKIMPSIPRRILFTPGSKMSQRGFRWAPMSLMGPTGLRSGYDSFPEHGGTLTEDGLRIKLPAFPIRMPTIPFLILKKVRAIFNDLGMGPDVPENFLIARTEDGTWLSITVEVENLPARSALWEMLQGSTSAYTLLLEEAPPDMDEHEIPTSALLVHYVSSESEAGQVISGVLLPVCRLTPDWVTLLEAGYQTSRNLLASDLTPNSSL
ncbi:MAG: hypothetical protein L6R37_005548 [Teloschistes peruensis]|nr:MAG: hypothetical protein L6R37_005548 [Teloschistes peruensis]